MVKSERNRNGVLVYVLKDQPAKSPKERWEQIHIMQLIRAHTPGEAALTWHTVNESDSKVQHRADLQRAGMMKGVSDIISISGGVACIEMKRARRSNSQISKEQTRFLLDAEKAGHFACVAYGAVAAWYAWCDYLNLPDLLTKCHHLLK